MKTISEAAAITKAAKYNDSFKTIKWEESCFEDENQLHDIEGIPSGLVGIVGSAVDYLSRMMITGDKSKAFEISFLFKKHHPFFVNNPDHELCKYADKLLEQITGLDDSSIKKACHLVCYDLLYRVNDSAFKVAFNAVFEHYMSSPPEDYKSTIENIRVMVQRCMEYFKGCAPVTETGFCVKYGNLYGDGDVVTVRDLCDLKTSKRKTSLKDKRQVLLYWYAGLHTEGLDFSKIDTLSIFNPRLNMAWKLNVSQLSEELLDDLDRFCWEFS